MGVALNILTLNAGSATLKYKLFQDEVVLADGIAEHDGGAGIVDAAEKVISDCATHGVDAIGHRMVHGGPDFSQPVRVTPEVLAELHGLRSLDPLHNPTETAMIETGLRILPNVPAVAVFDTAFHQTLPETAWRYAIPRDLADKLHLRRYGFHGLSHQYVSGILIARLGRGAEGTRVITCHLGSGASICAIKDGKSIDTSMGLTPLEGLVMGSRSGDIDPGLVLYLMRAGHMKLDEVDDLLNHRSGLLGLSGSSDDVRELEKSAQNGDANAGLALDVFAYRVTKYIGAYAAALEGVDAIAFTGGIGEHSSNMRSRICKRLAYLEVHLDKAANSQKIGQPTKISTEDAGLQVWVIPTDEERQIAREVEALLGRSD